MEYLGYIAALGMGLSLGLIGGGGSILTVPILVYFFQQDPLIATTGSLFVVGSTAIIGALSYARHGLVEFKTGVVFAVPSFAGVFLARKILLPALPSSLFTLGNFTLTKSGLILLSFASMMIAASLVMIFFSPQKTQGSRAPSLLHIAVRGVFVGAVTGFVGAGGGFLIIPALVVLLNLPMRNAVGTSLAIIAFNSLFGFMMSAGKHLIDWRVLVAVTGLGVIGLLAGQKLSPGIQEKKLKTGFGYFVLIVGLGILIDTLKK